ncbi:MAG TPA: hypothetical protein VIH25_12340 [Steroidobacteraceae bacterium]
MTGSKPKSSDDKLADDKAETPETSTAKKSGRVAFDARGNAVWEWSMSTGVFGRDVDNERLKKLEAPDLKIADDPPQKTKAFGTSPDERGPGFDPYNTHVHRPTDPQPKTTGVDPYNTVSSGRGKTGDRSGKPTDLKRLSEWIKRQRELQKKGE